MIGPNQDKETDKRHIILDKIYTTENKCMDKLDKQRAKPPKFVQHHIKDEPNS